MKRALITAALCGVGALALNATIGKAQIGTPVSDLDASRLLGGDTTCCRLHSVNCSVGPAPYCANSSALQHQCSTYYCNDCYWGSGTLGCGSTPDGSNCATPGYSSKGNSCYN
jgi:hypothetical protein